MSGLRGAVAFLTPVGGAARPSSDAVFWFPHVGALLGLALGAVWVLAAEVLLPLPAAAVVVAADLALTGMLHADGLADTADGLLPHLDGPERRLAVMAAPDVGAFGVAVVVMTLLLRVSALAVLAPTFLLPAALWCASRTAMGITLTAVPYARPEGGLASAFRGSSRLAVAAPGIVLACLLGAGWRPAHGLLAVAAAFAAAAAVVAIARRRVGGFTGDVLGAAGVVAETVGLLVAAGRLR